MLGFFDYTKVFLKVTVSNRSTKRAMTGSFSRAHFPWPSISRKWAKMNGRNYYLSVRLSQSGCFKPLYKRSHDQLLLLSTLFIVLYQPKVNENEMFLQITVNTNEIYRLDFLKVLVLNWSMKGAITESWFIVFYH